MKQTLKNVTTMMNSNSTKLTAISKGQWNAQSISVGALSIGNTPGQRNSKEQHITLDTGGNYDKLQDTCETQMILPPFTNYRRDMDQSWTIHRHQNWSANVISEEVSL
jgi:hypothetical protein